jgi:hypothetical protein
MNKVMLSFKRELLGHAVHIKKVAHLERLEVVDHESGEFTLVAHWKGGTSEQRFTRQYVLGKNIARAPIHQTPIRRVCRFRDDFIRGVLHARGI